MYKDLILKSTSHYALSTSSDCDAISKDINEACEIMQVQRLETALQTIFWQTKSFHCSGKCLNPSDTVPSLRITKL
jgi:hypothetical protein